MKKFLLAILSVLCICCFGFGAACGIRTTESNSSSQDDTPKSEIVVLNGFNFWEDMIVIYLDPATFDGSMKLNNDTDYIVEGEGSYKCYIHATQANQPELKMSAAKLKNDITDVTEFGLYIYNENEYDFDVIITAYAGDSVVCSPIATATQGANDLTFEINRAVVQKTGKVITDYSISFSGLQSGANFYLDNFYAKTTTEAFAVSDEAKEVLTLIDSFTDETEREALEETIGLYNALSEKEKQAITNYERLISLITPYWLEDLSAAQKDTPNTLLYFDEAFGPLQIKNTTAGISSYGYTTEMKYGEQKGSLKVSFTVTSTNWVNLVSTADTLIAEEYIEFYVYNDSEQYKAMCVGWKVPANTNDPNYMILEPYEWTKIFCKSTDLTDSGGSSGAFEICGLSDLTNRRACAPDGTMYFSAVMKKDATKDVVNARTGEDENTLLFFDRELGLQQITETGGVKEYSKDTLLDGKKGALKMTYAEDKSPTLSLMLAGYKFKQGDYVVFYVYTDVEADYLDIRVGTLFGTHCYNKKWTMVMFPAEAFDQATYLRFETKNDGGDYKPEESVDVTGSIYLTKAKVYSAEQVKDMSKVEETYDYKIGNTSFIGKVGHVGKNKGSYFYNNIIFASWYDSNVALVGNTLRVYARSEDSEILKEEGITTRETVIGLELKDEVECEGNKLYIIASGLVDDPEVDDLYLQIFTGRESGHFGSPRPVSKEVLEDGYVKYCFNLSGYETHKNYTGKMKYFRLGTGHKMILPDCEAVMIRDIYIA